MQVTQKTDKESDTESTQNITLDIKEPTGKVPMVKGPSGSDEQSLQIPSSPTKMSGMVRRSTVRFKDLPRKSRSSLDPPSSEEITKRNPYPSP